VSTFAIKGQRTGQLLSLGGRTLVHDNERELAFLFPNSQIVAADIPLVEQYPIRLHPDLASVRWPLDPKDFR